MPQHPFLCHFTLLVLLGGLVSGCASSQPPPRDAVAQAEPVGTWEYQVQGRAPLIRGLFIITRRDGQLRAIVRDQHRGRLYARVDLYGSRLELTIDDLRISGRIEEDRFRGFLRLRQWDVSTRRNAARRSSPRRRVSVSAERVRSIRVADDEGILDCRPILREANGCS